MKKNTGILLREPIAIGTGYVLCVVPLTTEMRLRVLRDSDEPNMYTLELEELVQWTSSHNDYMCAWQIVSSVERVYIPEPAWEDYQKLALTYFFCEYTYSNRRMVIKGIEENKDDVHY